MSEIITRFAHDEDLPEILHLFAKGMRGYEAYPYRLFWQWKHRLNPFGESQVLLAVHHKQIVGLRAFMRWQVVYGTKNYTAFRAVDTVTDPEYQGKGIFKRLTLELIAHLKQQEENAFIFNTPNKASRPGYLKMGWQILGRAPVFIRWVPTAVSYKESVWNKLQDALTKFTPTDIVRPNQSAETITVPKSLSYFHWRYSQYPVRDYALDMVERKEQLHYFFLKIKRRDYVTELRLCDVWVEGEQDWAFIAAHCIRLARQIGCQVVSILAEPHHTVTMLRNGYLPIQHFANIITIRDINCGEAFATLSQLDNWSFAMGDLELF